MKIKIQLISIVCFLKNLTRKKSVLKIFSYNIMEFLTFFKTKLGHNARMDLLHRKGLLTLFMIHFCEIYDNL